MRYKVLRAEMDFCMEKSLEYSGKCIELGVRELRSEFCYLNSLLESYLFPIYGMNKTFRDVMRNKRDTMYGKIPQNF